MREKGMNMGKVKVNNRGSLLSLLFRFGEMARIDLAKELHMTQAAITLLCNELLAEGVIIEKGTVSEQGRSGRRKMLIDINYDAYYVMGIFADSERAMISICDMKGDVLKKQDLPLKRKSDPEESFREIYEEGKKMWTSLGFKKNQILGIGAGMTGIVDHETGNVTWNGGSWKGEVPVKKILMKISGMHVAVENNVRSIANAEILYGIGKNKDNLMIVRWTVGVGSAIVINNELYWGRKNAAGELGHVIADPNGKQCYCGRHGCLETLISAKALQENLREIEKKGKTPKLSKAIKEIGDREWTPEEVSNLLVMEEPEVEKYCEKCADVFARALVNCNTMFAPNRILLDGTLFQQEKLFQKVAEKIKKYNADYGHAEIIHSELRDKITSIGPTSLIVSTYIAHGAL